MELRSTGRNILSGVRLGTMIIVTFAGQNFALKVARALLKKAIPQRTIIHGYVNNVLKILKIRLSRK